MMITSSFPNPQNINTLWGQKVFGKSAGTQKRQRKIFGPILNPFQRKNNKITALTLVSGKSISDFSYKVINIIMSNC